MTALNFILTKNPQADYANQPLPFSRLLGEQDGGVPLPKNYVGITGVFALTYQPTDKTGLCLVAEIKPKLTALDYWDTVSPVVNISGCLAEKVSIMPTLAKCSESHLSTVTGFSGCLKTLYQAMRDLRLCESPTITPNAGLFSGCLNNPNTPTLLLKDCRKNNYLHSQLIAHCTQKTLATPVKVKNCETIEYKHAVSIPCEYYPIEIPDTPTPAPISPCGEREPANELPLTFIRHNVGNKANLLPLPFTCVWRDDIPIRDSYMITNQITAETDDGTPLNLLDASIASDINGFCWQFSATLYPDDFAKLQMDAREHGNECVIKITINNELWVFMAEDYADNRQFGRKTYTVQGRSLTAKLGADYAKTQNGTINHALYARQIADTVLDLLPFAVGNWQIPDWFVPENAYTITDQTPLSVLGDIANSAGGFVESDKALPKLHFKPKWKVPAWQLANERPNLTLPESIIESISGQKQITTLCRGVFVMGDDETGVGADVFREGSDKLPRASVLGHSLYTDMPVCRAAGIAALSDTGTHKIESVKLPFATQYGVTLPELGSIVQVNESTGYWRGVVQGVRLDLTPEKGVKRVDLTLSIDRYLDT
ncbi:MAG: hypothetical protein IKZ88_04940 [Neisseriaceae bacterium]|nr:hypothetical protein [Neisseriaceae bacterium]